RRPGIVTGQVDDGLGRAQAVAADRPAGVLDPDDRLVERLELRSDKPACPCVDPALEGGDGVVDGRDSGAYDIDDFGMPGQRLDTRHAAQGAVDLFEDGGGVDQPGRDVARVRRGYDSARRPDSLSEPGRLGSWPRGGPRE